MFIARIPNRNSPPTYLLRESYRDENGKVRSRTLANLTHLSDEQREGVRRALKGGKSIPPTDQVRLQGTLAHGHVAAVLGMARHLGLEQLLGSRPTRQRRCLLAAIVARVLFPASKLATAMGLSAATPQSSLGEELHLNDVTANEFYQAMDGLVRRQNQIEKKLAQKHLQSGNFILYDLSSSYYTGSKCPLARYGYSRDRKRGFPQINYGLLCTRDGCPVSIEAFPGNTKDDQTLATQLVKLRQRFQLERMVIVGDRGVITKARITADLTEAGDWRWLTALSATNIRNLACANAIPTSLFDKCDIAEIESPDFPGERLIVCFNPLLKDERAEKRQELLAATQKELDKIVLAVQREKNPLRGAAAIGQRVGKIIHRYKMAKHFSLTITDEQFAYQRLEEKIAAETALDGIYILRTNVPKEELPRGDAVTCYKRLSTVERAFRCLKSIDLKIRPTYHRLTKRVRAHLLICMLAYYLEWHLRQKWASLLFDDDDKEAAAAQRPSPVAPAAVSASAKRKAGTRQNAAGEPVQSFRSLLANLGNLTKARIVLTAGASALPFNTTAEPTPLQRRAFELLGINP